ncbi:MAG: ribosome recycling factor [Deltaproteobacteria bacterium]|nr:ribosome recycling factor [Deltaproteobacteria bacterium]
MVDDVFADLKGQNQETLNALKNQLGKLRTGRANVAILDDVRVDYYGVPTPLNQCASVHVADARLIVVKPYEKKIIGDIEKAIMTADVGITPQSDGEVIRLPIPGLTEERRRELVKQAKHRGEEAKIALRNHRRDANELLKELEKEKEISQDDLKRNLENVQEILDQDVTKVDQIITTKEKEILEI